MQRRYLQIPLLLAALVPLALAGCQIDQGGSTVGSSAVAESPAEATVTPSATATLPPTITPSATATALPPSTATPLPTSTSAATPLPPTPTQAITPSPTVDITATVSSLATADPVDRTCPDLAPAKPDYRHFYLSAQPWPVLDGAAEKHFWLDKPLPGGGRFLYTEWLPYGYDAGGRYLLHNGIDSAEPEGTPVLAAADGTVIVAGDDYDRLFGWRCDWYGHLVVNELDRRWRDQPVYVVYGHVLEINVRPGETVSRGQQVAEVGFGGAAKRPHLHLEVRVGTNEFGATRNPLLWLRPPATRGIIAGRLLDPDGRPWQGVTVAAVGRSEDAETKSTWTYLGDPQDLAKPDESLAENFVLGDLKPGEYELYVEIQGVVYTMPVLVEGGKLTTVEIITEPLKIATPVPSADPAESTS